MVNAAEFRQIHSLFLAILQPNFARPLPVSESVQKILEETDPSASSPAAPGGAVEWLDLLDATIRPHQLRRYGEEHRITEPVAVALLRYWTSRGTPYAEDREKVDWIATYLFKAREGEGKQPTGWVKSELQTLLQGIPIPPLGAEAQNFLGELPLLLDDATSLEKFSQMTDLDLLERGRELKAQLGEDFCNPAALAAVVNYNLVLGKKFDALRERALAEAPQGRNPRQLVESLHNDYHSNSVVLTQLSELTRQQPAPQEVSESREVPAGPEPLLNRQLKGLGIDSEHELAKLRGRIRELATRLKATPGVRSIRICGIRLPLDDWEANALCSLSSRQEENLQGAFVRSVARAVGFLVRITEELYSYESKKGDGNPGWKKHHDALFYLLCEGRGHQALLQQLALLHRKSGLPELAQQLTETADKLRADLVRLDGLF